MTGRRDVAQPVAVVRLPDVLDDAAVLELRDELCALAGNPDYLLLCLDAAKLRSISARGLGLLAAAQLIAAGRGAAVVARSVAPALQSRLALVRIPSQDGHLADAAESATAEHFTLGWTPWWASAAANA